MIISTFIFKLSSNTLAEEIVIGHLLNSQINYRQILEQLHIHLFNLEKHRIIFLGLLNIYKEHLENPLHRVSKQLWTKNLLYKIGNIKNILKIHGKSQTLLLYYKKNTYLQYFIDILYYHYIKRLFKQYGHYILQLSYIYTIHLKDIQLRSTRYLDKITYILSTNQNQRNQHTFSHLILKKYIQTTVQQSDNIFSGFKHLDEITKGFKPGELIIIAGRPSMGKTSLAINIAYYITIKSNLPVYLFSLEMTQQEILEKMLALGSGININYLQERSIQQNHWINLQKILHLIVKSKLKIDDTGETSISYIRKQCLALKFKKKALIVDYLQLITTDNKLGQNRTQEIGNITRDLKRLAKEVKSPLIVLSQLNRNIETRTNKRPILSDLRESGCLSYNLFPKILTSLSKKVNTVNVNTSRYNIENLLCRPSYKADQQLTYQTSSYGLYNIYYTHNHKIFTINTWTKIDQLKRYIHHITTTEKLSSTYYHYSHIVSYFIYQIKKYDDEFVYDVMIQESCNLILDTCIIHNSIEQDADLILMLYKNDSDFHQEMLDIIIAKHRNGPTGHFQLLFYPQKCLFTNIESTL
uniref:DNA 5'-3' helicase n=1 Tax=Neogoniolithon spectabile TaxID=231755 RepID=A0A3G3MGN5_9FLOR|nr:replication helicase subunit [Neogoniolithon spectabile]AYR05995.1 replication helicase subunit [Neogoniolithon spectabile]